MTYISPETLQKEAEKLLQELIPKKDLMKAKERTRLPSQEMPTQDPNVRI